MPPPPQDNGEGAFNTLSYKNSRNVSYPGDPTHSGRGVNYSFRGIWDFKGKFRDFMGFYYKYQDFMGFMDIFWDFMGFHDKFRVFMGLYGILWIFFRKVYGIVYE